MRTGMGTKPSRRILPVLALLATLGAIVCGGPASDNRPESKLSLDDVTDPPAEFRPWVRWWWPGNDVEEAELAREVRVLADSYFGGAEVQPFDAALDPNVPPEVIARRRSFDTDSFYRNLAVALETALAKGISIDLTLGSGWPTGGMDVPLEGSIQTLLSGELEISGPVAGPIEVPKVQKTFFYAVAQISETLLDEPLARWEGDAAELVSVLAAKIAGGATTGDPRTLAGGVALDPASVVVLTDRVDASGTLRWDVPEGRWLVIATYRAPDGEYPKLIAEPEPGYVVDHLDRGAVLAHLDHLLGPRTGIPAFFGAPFRAFFNDSLEFRAERLYATDLLAEFRRRRGYDLTPFLPAVFVPGADNTIYGDPGIEPKPRFVFSPEDDRLRYDYALTVSDLFVDRFLESSGGWARAHGLLSRVQAHGVDVDLLRAYAAADIPESEQLYAGGTEMFLKMSSSGAHQGGRPIVSAESLVWMGRDHMTTPLKIKAAADKLFTSGVNHLIYHGFPYRLTEGYGETGWSPFSSPYGGMETYSSHVSETDPFWKFLPEVNRYIARCQYLLRQGRPEADVLVYYPWIGFSTSFILEPRHDEFLFSGYLQGEEPPVPSDPLTGIGVLLGFAGADPRSRWLEALWPTLQELESQGYTWEWVNDEGIARARSEQGKIVLAGNRYGGLVVPETPTLQPAAARNLAALAREGVAVLCLAEPPAQQPGFRDWRRGDAIVGEAMRKVMASGRAGKLDPRGKIAEVLAGLGVEPGVRFTRGAEPIRCIRRRVSASSQTIFFRNPERRQRELAVTVAGGCEEARWLDAWTGESRPAGASGTGELVTPLPAYGSAWLLCGADLPAAAQGATRVASPTPRRAASVKRLDSWKLTVIGEDVPGGSLTLDLAGLASWQEIEALRTCSSAGLYATSTSVSALEASQGSFLDLGWLFGAAEVRVNGRDAGTLLVPPYRLDVSGLLVPGENRIEVTIIPALRNRLVGKGNAGEALYARFRGKDDTLLPGGLVGPVELEIGAGAP